MKSNENPVKIRLFYSVFSDSFFSGRTNSQSRGRGCDPLTIDAAEFAKYPQIKVSRKDKEGKDHTYTGVALMDILTKAGATMGDELKGKNLTKCLLVDAADNYQAVFALAELDKAFTECAVILTNTVDGKPLPKGDGPFRIIVQNEKSWADV
ncbi:molybdopterin-dependent oxidoreductase [Mucilaginibacter antarcticus]|uniref:molybdopterin-dependent oxidoreductase n=1 Tax=Mucilaginibacter antarcticus TaxID=1855725 RepID=UPI003644C215